MNIIAGILTITILILFWTNKQLQKEKDFYKGEAIDILKRSSRYVTFTQAEAELTRKFNEKGKK